MSKRKKVLIIAEYLNPPYDEGIKKATYNLFIDLDNKYNVHAVCRVGYIKKNISTIDTNPLFFSNKLKSVIKKFNPPVIIYFPFASGTFASYLRLKVFQFIKPSSKFIFINLQDKPLSRLQKLIVKPIKPDIALTPSHSLMSYWQKKGIKAIQIPLMTDLTKFNGGVSSSAKAELRKKYSIPQNSYIISHMGHLNENRNLRSLIPLQQAGYQIVIVGSSSTPLDSIGPASLKEDLESSGIIVIDGFVKNIEEIYQLSDIYIFPVIIKNGSISFPLSVLEARACHTPVITTEYGSLKHFLGDDFGNVQYLNPNEFIDGVRKVEQSLNLDSTKTKVNEINNLFFNHIYSEIEK